MLGSICCYPTQHRENLPFFVWAIHIKQMANNPFTSTTIIILAGLVAQSVMPATDTLGYRMYVACLP